MVAVQVDEGRGRRVRGHLLALTGSLLLCLLVGEAAARIFFWEEVSNEAIEARLRPATGERSLVRPHPDPEIFYELVPNLRRRFLGTLVRTDAQGIRIGAVAPRKSTPRPGSRLIVGIGDSSMFGWGVRQRDTYLHQLEAKLNEVGSDRSFEVRNLAVPGYNSEQELAVLRKKALAMGPEALVLHYDHNDPDPIGAEYQPDYVAPETGDNALGSALVKLVVRRATYARNRNRIHVEGQHKAARQLHLRRAGLRPAPGGSGGDRGDRQRGGDPHLRRRLRRLDHPCPGPLRGSPLPDLPPGADPLPEGAGLPGGRPLRRLPGPHAPKWPGEHERSLGRAPRRTPEPEGARADRGSRPPGLSQRPPLPGATGHEAGRHPA